MARERWDTAIIGAGPVGLATALAAARQGAVRVFVRRRAENARAFRIDAAPAPLLALLVELGLHPAQMGVETVHNHRLIAWEGAEPQIAPCSATIHLPRPALELALFELARRRANITLDEREFSKVEPTWRLCLDASGRTAVSAMRRIIPKNPPMCSVFALHGAFSKAQQAFRLAATSQGYVYRIGAPTAIAIGIVQGRDSWTAAIRDLAGYLRGVGAQWLVAGLDVNEAMRAMGGMAGVQWTIGPPSPIRVGDAAFARDPLSAQGISNGISVGLKALERGSVEGQVLELRSHLKNLRKTIAACRYADSPYWRGSLTALKEFEKRIAEETGSFGRESPLR